MIEELEHRLADVLRQLENADDAGCEEKSIRLSLEADGLRKQIQDLMREKAS